MKIYLDDLRSAPQGWTRCYSANEVLTLLSVINMSEVEDMSIDYDLGKLADNGGNAVKVVQWMAETNNWPKHITVHLRSNERGAEKVTTILELLKQFAPQQKEFLRVLDKKVTPKVTPASTLLNSKQKEDSKEG